MNLIGMVYMGRGYFIGQEDLPSLDVTEENGSPSPATSRIPSGRDWPSGAPPSSNW